ncbi:hypothetical protein BaRGS_00024518 [Batillaria attramentaria]|uniref:Amidohydrolase-related domain-containing protein n=1 Tax=Batillaria attramentaria TaxID=370345 RepID=A0ABD0KAW8_9CAEN
MAEDVVFCGTVVHATPSTPLELLENAILGVKQGKVVFLDRRDRLQQRLKEHEIDSECVQQLSRRQFLMPGLVDCHIHAPQLPIQGVGTDMGLLDWLNTYTFPTEARFKSPEFARDAHYQSVRRALQSGTTAACYFSTIHRETTTLLCDAVDDLGQRALVGKVNMDMSAPDYYRETTEQSVADTSPLVTPVITPRFAVSCTQELMTSLGQLAKERNVPIQLHPGKSTYTHVYDDAGLLGPNTILAHCVHVTDEELAILKERDCGVVHCACSNTTLRSGVMDMRRMLDHGIKLGLGTDVAGGYSPTILSAMRQASSEHGQQNGHTSDYQRLTMDEAFRLATLGGSTVLGMNCGNFEPGREFDALVIDPEVKDTPLDLFTCDTADTVVHKFLYTGDDRNMTQIYVQGRKVMDKTHN